MIANEPPADFFEEVLRDPLTGLPIPALQREHLQLALLRARRTDTAVALLLVDLLGLREVHERYGIVIGDLVVQSVAGRIRSALRSADVVSRLDDDQFSIVCEDVASDGDVDRIANRVRAAITTPLVVEGHPMELGATIGIAVSTSGRGAVQLLRDADAAMTEARRR